MAQARFEKDLQTSIPKTSSYQVKKYHIRSQYQEFYSQKLQTKLET